MPAGAFDYRKSFSLDGKVALVTGAAGSLGAEMCRGLAAAGASVLVTDVSSEGGEALVRGVVWHRCQSGIFPARCNHRIPVGSSE